MMDMFEILRTPRGEYGRCPGRVQRCRRLYSWCRDARECCQVMAPSDILHVNVDGTALVVRACAQRGGLEAGSMTA